MIHPCRAARDSFGNPRYQLHAFEYEEGSKPAQPKTICGLVVRADDVDGGWRWQIAYMCPTCYPTTPPPAAGGGGAPDPDENHEEKLPWTEQNPWAHGLPVGDRGYSEETLLKRYKPE